MTSSRWEFKFLPLPVATLAGYEARTITAVPLLGGEVRELHFPPDTLDRFNVGSVKCDGRNVLGRLTRRGVLFMCAAFNRGSRLSVALTNLKAHEVPVRGFAFGVVARTLSQRELLLEIDALGRQLQAARTNDQVAEIKNQLRQLEALRLP